MIDDKYSSDDTNWYKGRWQLVFSKSRYTDNKVAYTIFSDRASYGGDASSSEIARNPQNSEELMSGGYGNSPSIDIRNSKFKGMKALNIGKKFGITSVKLKGGCSSSRISFDYLGRVLKGDHSSMNAPYSAKSRRLVKTECKIILSDSTHKITIIIEPETGYIFIDN